MELYIATPKLAYLPCICTEAKQDFGFSHRNRGGTVVHRGTELWALVYSRALDRLYINELK